LLSNDYGMQYFFTCMIDSIINSVFSVVDDAFDTIVGIPIRINHIRANRPNPGNLSSLVEFFCGELVP